jgi:Bacterial Ig domain/NHL repeat
MFSISFKNLTLASLIVAMCACGGGKSGGNNGPTGGTSSSSIASLTVTAGADKTVNAGDRVDLMTTLVVVSQESFSLGDGNLVLKGASANPKDIVLVSWTKVDGPAVSLGLTGTTTANVNFTAPSAGTANSYTIVYKLSIATADGTKAEDTVTITVNRVNVAPIANAGSDATVDGNALVNLAGSGSDADGTIASYSWAQTAGAAVTLTGATAAALRFTAPSTNVETTLTFELTVTDNNAVSAKDTVSVLVKPESAPLVQLYFPSRFGIYKDTTISASGIATPKSGTISGVTIDVGNGPVPTTLNSDGTWRINGVQVPAGVAEFTIQVVATDSVGRTGNTKATFKTSGDSVGKKIDDTANWRETLGVAVDNSKNVAYVLATGSFFKDLRLFPVDLATGDQGADISNFADTEQGINSSAITSMTYDAQQNLVYIATALDEDGLKPQIISINITNGQRNLVSDNTRGTGAELVYPTGLAIGANNTLYVADNNSSTIVAVNTVTGNRTVLANKDSVEAPLHLVSEVYQTINRLFVLANANANYVLTLSPSVVPVSLSFVTNSSMTSQGIVTLHANPQGIVVDSKMNALFVNDGSVFSQIVKVDITTGNRTQLMATDWTKSYMSYDTKNQLLYLVDGISPGLYLVDPFTGKKVLISK